MSYCQLRGGRLPFAGTPAAMVAGHLGRPPDLTMLPPEERPVVGRALAKRPGDRWPTCRAFVEAVADPEVGATAARRPGRRPPWLLALAVVLGLGALLALLLTRESAPAGPKVVGLVRGFDLPRRPLMIRNVAVKRVGPPLNRAVALSNGSGGPALWDVATGKILRRFPGPGGPGVALAPLEMPLGLTGDDEGNVVLWDLASGQEVRRFRGHTLSVSSVAFSPDGSQVLTGSCDATVRLFNRHSGKEIHCLRGHKGIVMGVAFEPRGRRALSGGWDGTVRVWDLEAGKQVGQFDGHTGPVWCVAYSWDGRYGLSGGQDRTVRLWDLARGQEVRRFDGHTDQVSCVVFRDYNWIVSVGDRTARVWDLNSGRELYRSPEQPSIAHCAAFVDLDGTPQVLIGTASDGLRLWRLPKEAPVSGAISGRETAPLRMRQSAPGQLVQFGEDSIQGRRIKDSQTLQAVALVEGTHLKHEGDRGNNQAVLPVGLNQHSAGEARCVL